MPFRNRTDAGRRLTVALADPRSEADEVVCLEDHAAFRAIGFHHAGFSRVNDQEVIDILTRYMRQADRFPPTVGPAGYAQHTR